MMLWHLIGAMLLNSLHWERFAAVNLPASHTDTVSQTKDFSDMQKTQGKTYGAALRKNL